MTAVGHPKQKERLPVVLIKDEVQTLFFHLDGVYGLLARLLYGTGMRIAEARQCRLPALNTNCGFPLGTIATLPYLNIRFGMFIECVIYLIPAHG